MSEATREGLTLLFMTVDWFTRLFIFPTVLFGLFLAYGLDPAIRFYAR